MFDLFQISVNKMCISHNSFTSFNLQFAYTHLNTLLFTLLCLYRTKIELLTCLQSKFDFVSELRSQIQHGSSCLDFAEYFTQNSELFRFHVMNDLNKYELRIKSTMNKFLFDRRKKQ